MSRVVVVGAGVVGQTYAGLLASAGHDVSLVARGHRAERLRTSGIALQRRDLTSRPTCHIVSSLDDAGPADVVLVAVRGDQLPTVQSEIAASLAPIVACLSNPLGHRADFERAIGAERTVFSFSGIGGLIAADGSVHYHHVNQQPTVVDVGANAGPAVAALMASTGLAVRREAQMGPWLDTHSVFIAGMGAAILTTENAASGVAHSRQRVREVVLAISEAFDALQSRGLPVRPFALRIILGRVPMWIAAGYWQRQFAGPVVQISIAPHVLSTHDTEFPQIVDHALGLIDREAPRYRQLVRPCASPATES